MNGITTISNLILKSQIVTSSRKCLKQTGLLIDSSNNPYWAWPFFTPEALNKSNRRWSPAKREAEPAGGRGSDEPQPRQGAEQQSSGSILLPSNPAREQDAPATLFNPCRGCQQGERFSAGSASRFAGLHRRLLLFNAFGVKTLNLKPQIAISSWERLKTIAPCATLWYLDFTFKAYRSLTQ